MCNTCFFLSPKLYVQTTYVDALSYEFLLPADTNKGIDQCYSRNSGSDGRFGNCGHDPSQDQFLRCSSEDEMCGVLFCEPGDFTNPNSIFTTIITVTNRDDNGVFRDCRGSVTPSSSDAVNPGLVDEGTKCGDEMVCLQTGNQSYCMHGLVFEN